MPAPSIRPGTRLGPYEVVCPLGAGGMGEVYRARDPRLGRDVALKVLPAEFAADASRRQRFEVEARAVAALSHPNIVPVYDVGEGYIVSELVEGETLRGARFGLRKTLDVAAQIAAGMAAAHAAGIVHRDLKPDNVLLTKDGRARILDFGLARMLAPGASGSPGITEPGVVMGTVDYMSPEQARGAETDARSDVFSLGVMLHELLGGARPFQGETPVDTLQAILRAEAPDLPPSVPAGVRQVVAHCLEKDPDQRFQSASDLGFALRALAQGSGGSEVAQATAPRAARRRAWLAAVAVLLALAVTALVTAALTREAPRAHWFGEPIAGPALALTPRPSPDGGLLAFQALVDGQAQLAVMDPESGTWRVLTDIRDQGLVEYLCWSPDGGTIYFSRTVDVPTGVFSVPFLGGEERLVLANAANPAALPDGSLLVAQVNEERREQLTRFWPDTGRLQRLPVGLAFDPALRPGARVSRDGRRVVALGTLYDGTDERSLIEVDLDAGTAHRIEVQGDLAFSAFALSPDGASVVAAVPADALTRIVRIPLDGPRVPEDLFTATSDVWNMDVTADGRVLLNLVDRPVEVVHLDTQGAQVARIAHVPRATASKQVVALADGRDVVDLRVSGRMRLMVLDPERSPEPLLKSDEESASPMTALAGKRIAFAIGPEPRETLAVADTETGRVLARIPLRAGAISAVSASADGETLYVSAGGSVWSVATAGGESRRVCPGSWVVAHPSGSLVVARQDADRRRLFEVWVEDGRERELDLDPGALFYSLGTIRDDGLLAASLMTVDSWFVPLGLVDLTTGTCTRIAGDGVSEVVSAAWAPDGTIVALRQGIQASIWTFTPSSP